MIESSLFAKIIRRAAAIWLELLTGVLWWVVGYIPIHHVRRFCYRLAGMKIGAGSALHMMGRVYDPRQIVIGQDSIIGEQFILDGRRQLPGSNGGLTIGDHVDIASQVMIWTSEHDVKDPLMKPVEEPVVIEDYVFIGPRAIILPGITIHRGAVVAAGAVVTKDVPELAVVAGIPAKQIDTRPVSALGYQLGRARWFQ